MTLKTSAGLVPALSCQGLPGNHVGADALVEDKQQEFSMAQQIREEKARQANWGYPVLVVLVCALLLAAVAWWGAELFGQPEPQTITPQNTEVAPPPANGTATTPQPATQQ